MNKTIAQQLDEAGVKWIRGQGKTAKQLLDRLNTEDIKINGSSIFRGEG